MQGLEINSLVPVYVPLLPALVAGIRRERRQRAKDGVAGALPQNRSAPARGFGALVTRTTARAGRMRGSPARGCRTHRPIRRSYADSPLP